MECKKYQVMSGEPHLGKIEECELIADKYEVEDMIIDQLYDDCDYPSDWKFYFPDENTGYDITVNAKDYIDIEMVEGFFAGLEDGELINIVDLYARAGVDSPNARSKK